jgi:hypothetical protein
MKQSTLSKITASVAVARGMVQRALAASPNPQWTEHEICAQLTTGSHVRA